MNLDYDRGNPCLFVRTCDRANVTAPSRRITYENRFVRHRCAVGVTSALVHHSNSAFDGDKVMVLIGTTGMEADESARGSFCRSTTATAARCRRSRADTGQLVRAGWSRTTLKAGETITVDFSPAKDGTRTGLLTRVRRADGTVVGQQTPPAAQ